MIWLQIGWTLMFAIPAAAVIIDWWREGEPENELAAAFLITVFVACAAVPWLAVN